MSRSARRAYEKEAGTRTWESEKKRLGAKGNKQNTKASSKSWRRKRELELAKKDQTTIRESKNSTERKKQKLFSLGPTQYTV
jgi:ribosomal protein L34E